MLSKVNIWSIVCDHFGTFRRYSTSTASGNGLQIRDFVLFLGMPGVVAVIVTVFYGNLATGLVPTVGTFLAIFAALLFNLLLLAYDLIRRGERASYETVEIRKRLLREIVSNISFAILVAISAIVLLLVLLLVDGCLWAAYAVSAATYYLVPLFVLTLLMLLKRVYSLLVDDVQQM